MDFTFFLSLSHLQVLIPLPDPLRFPEQDLGPLLGQRQRDGQIALLVYQLDFFHLEEKRTRREIMRGRRRNGGGGNVVVRIPARDSFFYLSGSLPLIGLDFISVFGGTPRGLAQMTSAERGEKGGCSKSYSRKRGYMDLVLTRGEGCPKSQKFS